MKAKVAVDFDKELLQSKVNNKNNVQLISTTTPSKWNNNKVTNILSSFKIATNIKQQKGFKRALNIKKSRFKRATKVTGLKGATNVTHQLNNYTSCKSSSSSSTDCSSRQKKKALRTDPLGTNDTSAISTEQSDSTKSREARKRVKDTDGDDKDPVSMILSPERTTAAARFGSFDYMQARYGVALPFYLPESVVGRFIDLNQMGKGKKCRCPRIYIPVCSYNNRTYVNECIMNCIKAKKRRNGPCIAYRRKHEHVQVFIPSEWDIHSENKIKPQKRKHFLRRILNKIKEKFKKFWNFITRRKQKPTIDTGRINHTMKSVRSYLIDNLTAMNIGDRIEAFTNDFLKIANKTVDKKDFTDLLLRATYTAEDDFLNRFSDVIKSTENHEHYIKDMLLDVLGFEFYERVNSLFSRNVSDEFKNVRNSWKIAPTYNNTL